MSGPQFEVKEYVKDTELKEALNQVLAEKGEIYAVYRNKPSDNGIEPDFNNTTIVYVVMKGAELPAEVEEVIDVFKSSNSETSKRFLQTGHDWMKTLDICVDKLLGWADKSVLRDFMDFGEFESRLRQCEGVYLGVPNEAKEADEEDSVEAGAVEEEKEETGKEKP